MNDNKPTELPATNEIGFRTFKSLLKSGVSGQAAHNAFAVGQDERELRLRANLDKLESVQNLSKEPPTDH